MPGSTRTSKIVAKHVPLRTCVACGQTRPKRQLVRIVLDGEEAIVDITGKKPGRGTYLCSLKECWKKGISGKKLERALGASLSPENRERLNKHGEELDKEEVENTSGQGG